MYKTQRSVSSLLSLKIDTALTSKILPDLDKIRSGAEDDTEIINMTFSWKISKRLTLVYIVRQGNQLILHLYRKVCSVKVYEEIRVVSKLNYNAIYTYNYIENNSMYV